ncbi:MAG: histidine kinase [Actinomycetota bacterium]
MPTRGVVMWWSEWLSVSGGHDITAPSPGRIEILYRNMAASVSRHATVADTALAVALAACTVPQLVHWAREGHGLFGDLVLFSALLVAPLILRRRFPLSTFAFAAVVALAQWIVNVELTARATLFDADVALLVYLYTVANRYRMRVGVLAAAVVEVGTVMAAISWPLTHHWAETFLLLSGPVVASLLLGVNVRHWRNSLSALTERAEQLERERDQQARIAAAAERTRIAREMHDVVAHSLSVIVTLSEGAALKQAAEPERATMAMRQVSATGHQALDEMRRLLGVLRTEDDPGSRQPQPGMAQIDELFDQVRATGLTAELTVTGTPAAVPPGAELTVYRIVQEALTNTLKHAAGPTRIGVLIAYRPDSVTVDVHDDGARRSVRPEARTAGHGLTGMRERAAVYGGAVSAGPAPTGGWHIHAHLPMTASTPATASGRAR